MFVSSVFVFIASIRYYVVYLKLEYDLPKYVACGGNGAYLNMAADFGMFKMPRQCCGPYEK